jgi:hypothetical protein
MYHSMSESFKQPVETNIHTSTESQKPVIQGITFRALIIGVCMIPIMCLWVEYSEIVAQATDLAAMSLPIAVVFGLVVLIAINLVIGRYWPRKVLTQAELLYIFLMQTVSVGISGIGMMQFLNTMVANIYYYATPENSWSTSIIPLLRPWILPNEKVLHGYYAGKSSIYNLTILRGWITPIIVWTLFIFVLLTVMLCINVILRKQWIDRERLTFPIVTLPLELTRDNGNGPILRNKLLWIGFAIPVVLESLASLNHLYPAIPFFPIKPSDPRLDITATFTAAPWSGMGYTAFSFYPMVIGLTYFLTLDVGFSLWFFYLFSKGENIVCTALGYHDPGASMMSARMPYLAEQSVGAFIALAILVLWGMRSSIKEIIIRTFTRAKNVDDSNEPLPYRWAVIGLIVGYLLLTGFGVALGMRWWVPAVFFILYLLFIISFTRIRAEAGLPWGYGPDMNPHQVMLSGVGSQSFNKQTLAGFASILWFDLDYRCVAMPSQLEAMKFGESARMNNRHIAYAIMLATLIGALASWWAVLTCYYQYGAASAHVNSWRTDMGKVPWQTLKTWMDTPVKQDWARMQ